MFTTTLWRGQTHGDDKNRVVNGFVLSDNQIWPVFGAVMAIMGFCSRQDSLGGVTSWVRCTGVNPDKYTQFVGLFHLLGKKGSSRSC